MNGYVKMLAALKRYGNFRENWASTHEGPELRKRKKAEWKRVTNALFEFKEGGQRK